MTQASSKGGPKPPKTSAPLESASKFQSLASKAAASKKQLEQQLSKTGKTVVFKNFLQNPNTLLPNGKQRKIPNGVLGEHDVYSLTTIFIPSEKFIHDVSEETGIDYTWMIDEIKLRNGKFMGGNYEIAYSSREQSLFRVNHAKDAMGNYMNEPEFFTFLDTAVLLNEVHDAQKIKALRLNAKNSDNPFLSPDEKADCKFHELRPDVEAEKETEMERIRGEFLSKVFSTPYDELIAIAVCVGVTPDILANSSPENDILRSAVLKAVGTDYRTFLNLFDDPDIEYYTNYEFAKALSVIFESNGEVFWQGQTSPFKKLGPDSRMNLMKKFAEYAKSAEGASVYQEILNRLAPFQN